MSDGRPDVASQLEYVEIARTIHRVLYALIAVGGFCLLVLASPDEVTILAGGKFNVPFFGTKVSVHGFLRFGPLLLIGMSVYLHIFVGRLRAFDPAADGHGAAFIFTMPSRAGTVASAIVFYWFVPLVLFAFFWTALPRPEAPWLAIVTALIATASGFLQLDRWPGRTARTARIAVFGIVAITITALPFAMFYSPARGALLSLRSVDLYRADLKKADLRGVDLYEADMRGVDLYEADLGGAVLTKADLRTATLSKANLDRAKLGGADLRQADLRGAWLQDANLRRAHLTSTNLSGAKLRAADLIKAKLFHAGLRGADLSGANLTGADLRVADLTGADLTGANLTGAEFCKTTMPDGSVNNDDCAE